MSLGDCAPRRQATEKPSYSKALEIAPVRGDWLVVDAVSRNPSHHPFAWLTGEKQALRVVWMR